MPKADARDSDPSGAVQREISQSRHALLGMTAALGAARATAGEQDPHPAWWAEYERLEALSLDVKEGPDFDDLLGEQIEVLEQIATAPATTAAGVLAQVHVVRLGIEIGETEFDRDALQNALATLEQLAGRA